MTDITSLRYAQTLDRQDELAHFRNCFVVGDPDLIYLDGNSLGRLPHETVNHLHHVVEEQWGSRLIRSWNEGWFTLTERIGSKIAILIGAQPDEVVLADSTSVNLFKLALAALQTQPKRHKIVTDDMNFPSDIHILDSASRLAGHHYRIVVAPSADGIHGPVNALADAIDKETALVSLSHTCFKSGYTYDMAEITQLAHGAGALILWDMSHSVGAVPGMLSATQADLAVGCTYKYLNGGPGAPAWLYVRRDLQERLRNPVAGWMGQQNMFDFQYAFSPADGMRRFFTGTAPILSVSAIEPGVDILLEAGIEKLRAKSVQQTEYLIALWEVMLKPLGFELNSPRNAAQRGSHISLGHEDAWPIDQALIHEMNVLPDFRQPDNIRLGIAPLYTSYEEIFVAMQRIESVVTKGLYKQYNQMDVTVT